MDNKPRDEEDMDRWLGLLTDKEKADVLKARVKAESDVRLAEVEAKREVDRTVFSSDGYYVVRFAFLAVVFAAVITVGIVSYHYVDVRYGVPDKPDGGAR